MRLWCLVYLAALGGIALCLEAGVPERIRISNNHTLTRTRFVPRNSPAAIPNTNNPAMNTSVPCGTKEGSNITLRQKTSDTNQTITMDGKKYKVMRVTKKQAPRGERCLWKSWAPQGGTRAEPPMQRRTFTNLLGNLSNSLPMHWVTKKEGNGTEGWNLWKGGGNKAAEGKETPTKKNTYYYHGDKIKKLLNLFTIVKFDNGGCYFDGLKGTCYHYKECQDKGGRSIGACARGFGVCCYIEKSCGERTAENCTYFVNEGFPQPSRESPRVCALTVEKASPLVRQLRIEFQTFELRGPSNGTCLADRFIVTGHNDNDRVPDICGVNTGQHMYVDVDETNGPVTLNVVTMGLPVPRNFRIKVTQLQQNDALLAPKSCLQYHADPTGVVHSFNYQPGGSGSPTEAMPGYFNNLNYVICVRKAKGFCSVTYTNDDSAVGDPRFQLSNVDQGGEPLVPPRQGGAEIFNCPDDYLVVNGVRICGERLNDASLEVDYTRNAPVTDRSSGPFVLPVVTDQAVTGRGFYLTYRQNPCLG